MSSFSMTSDDLESLATFLTSDATPPTAMPPDMLHGFLTALLTGPATLPLTVWFPYIWSKDGRERPRFDDPQQGARIVNLIMRMLADIKASLDDPHGDFQPLVSLSYLGDDAYKDGRMWAVGFMEAVRLHRDEWASFLESDVGQNILEPVLLLQGKRPATGGEAPLGTAEQIQEWTTAISDAVEKSCLYFYEERLQWASFDEAESEVELGTTAPPVSAVAEHCPCGSGRPYKACCGHWSRLH
jgi:uncharacterized protein